MPPQSESTASEKVRRDLDLVEDWFTYHAPTEHQQALLLTTRGLFRTIAQYLVVNVADSRERAIALTELRKAAMCANQAIIFDRSLG